MFGRTNVALLEVIGDLVRALLLPVVRSVAQDPQSFLRRMLVSKMTKLFFFLQ